MTARSADRRGRILVGLVLAASVILRVLFPGHISVEHFDEGVYASNIWFSGTANPAYPYQHLYAPPLLPHCITIAQILDVAFVSGGETPSDFASILPSQLAAIGTLLGIAWIVRSWFGTTAALCSCILLAGNDLHIAYSRTAMTDVPAVFWMVLAVGAMVTAFQRESYRWALAAAVLLALGWWTKYSGWLPLAIGISGLLAASICHWVPRRFVIRSVCIWLVIAILSFSLWYPHVYSLRNDGGYASVAENHRQYVVGTGGWWNSAQRQWTNVQHFDSWIGYFAVAAAASLAAAQATRPSRQVDLRAAWHTATVAVATFACCVSVGTAPTLLLLACCGIASHFISVHADRDTIRIGRWCGLAAWAGLLLATPMYTPYPRLALPFLVWTIVWSAEGCRCLGRGLSRFHQTDRYRVRYAVVVTISLVVIGLSWQNNLRHLPAAWEDRSGMRDAAASINRRIRTLSDGVIEDPIIFVYGEPALLHQLNQFRLPSVVPLGGFQQLERIDPEFRGSIFVLTVNRDGARAQELAKYRDNLDLVDEFHYRPSGLVMLNYWSARTVRERQRDGYLDSIGLYRVRSVRPDG